MTTAALVLPAYFEAGHMMSIDRAAHARLKKDVADFIRNNSNLQ